MVAERLARREARRRRTHRQRAGAGVLLAVIAIAVLIGANAGHKRTAPARPHAPRARRAGREVSRVARILGYTSYIALGGTRHREVALTFDDGPSPYTLPILAVLQRYRVKATFFEIGRQVSADPRITAALARAGMTIGDHTETHPPMAELSSAEQALQIDHAAQAIHAASAPAPLLWRPPYGSFNATTLKLLRAREMTMVLWTVDTSDYARPGVKRIVYTALSGARPGAIILFHDGGGNRSQTLAALPRIIQRLRQRGYRLVTVPQLLADDPPPPHQSPPHNLAGVP